MLKRKTYQFVKKALSRQAAVALIGPRQVGKTTLALEIGQELNAIYLDLESPSERNKLFDAELYLSQYQVGSSFEGFAIENIVSVLPDKTPISFYRSSNGAEIDLILSLPNNLGTWAIEIKRGLTARPEKGFYYAISDIQASRSFVVYAGKEHYKIAENIEAINLEDFCKLVKAETES